MTEARPLDYLENYSTTANTSFQGLEKMWIISSPNILYFPHYFSLSVPNLHIKHAAMSLKHEELVNYLGYPLTVLNGWRFEVEVQGIKLGCFLGRRILVEIKVTRFGVARNKLENGD